MMSMVEVLKASRVPATRSLPKVSDCWSAEIATALTPRDSIRLTVSAAAAPFLP
jgi:hypothetical protein